MNSKLGFNCNERDKFIVTRLRREFDSRIWAGTRLGRIDSDNVPSMTESLRLKYQLIWLKT